MIFKSIAQVNIVNLHKVIYNNSMDSIICMFQIILLYGGKGK